MAQGDRLRVGRWVPSYDPVADHRHHRLPDDAHADREAPPWSGLRPPPYPDEWDDAGRRYRGQRRADPPRHFLALIAALVVVAVVLLVATGLPRRHDPDPVTGGA